MTTTPSNDARAPRPDLRTRYRELDPHPHAPHASAKATKREGFAADLSVVALAFIIATVMLVGSFTMVVRGQQVPGPTFFPLIIAGLLYAVGVVLLIMVLRPHQDDTRLENRNVSQQMLRDLAGTEDLQFPTGGGSPVLNRTDLLGITPAERAQPSGITEQDVADAGGGAEGLAAPTTPDAAEAPGEQKDPDTAYPLDWRTVGLTVGAVVLFIVTLNFLGWIISAAAMFWIVAYAFGSRRPLFDIGLALLISSFVQLVFSALLGLNLPSGFIGGIF